MPAVEDDPAIAHAELLAELHARVHALHHGLAAVLDLVACAPPGHAVRAATVQVLLAPLAAEAEQAAAAAALLAQGQGEAAVIQ